MKLRRNPIEAQAVEWTGAAVVGSVPTWYRDALASGSILVRLDELHAGPVGSQVIVRPGCYLLWYGGEVFGTLTNDELLAGWSVVGAKKAKA